MSQLGACLEQFAGNLNQSIPYNLEGKLVGIKGLTIEAVGCPIPIHARCLIVSPNTADMRAEVVGFSDKKMFLMPVGKLHDMAPGAKIIPDTTPPEILTGQGLLGRVLNGQGQPIDGRGPLQASGRVPFYQDSLNPLERQGVNEPLDVGIRSINSLLTVGKGQRIGLFAGTGVGKSVLLGMMTRFTNADITIVALIGERGREIKEFIDDHLGPEGLKRSVVVVAPADEAPLTRVHGTLLAVRLAEYYRDLGMNVLLLMDSLTRYAQAQREISLSIGEPPISKGYPPSVFSKISQLVERTGNGREDQGTITAFFTVLVEGDDHQEPVSDATKALLDGHIVLSRQMAERGLYPAIDPASSISRVMQQVSDPEQYQKMLRFKQVYSTYQNNRDLINVGAYTKGSDPKIDEAIAMMPRLEAFLSQGMTQQFSLEDSLRDLELALQAETLPPEMETEASII